MCLELENGSGEEDHDLLQGKEEAEQQLSSASLSSSSSSSTKRALSVTSSITNGASKKEGREITPKATSQQEKRAKRHKKGIDTTKSVPEYRKSLRKYNNLSLSFFFFDFDSCLYVSKINQKIQHTALTFIGFLRAYSFILWVYDLGSHQKSRSTKK